MPVRGDGRRHCQGARTNPKPWANPHSGTTPDLSGSTGRRWQGAIRYSSGRHPARHIISPGAGIGPLARALCWSIMVQHPMRTTKRHRHNYATLFIVTVVPKGVCALPHAAPSHQFVRRSADRCSGHLSCAGDGERRLPIGSGPCANALSRARTFGPRFRVDFVLRARAGRGVN